MTLTVPQRLALWGWITRNCHAASDEDLVAFAADLGGDVACIMAEDGKFRPSEDAGRPWKRETT